ncbi:hypothetical protein HZS61_007127 [Fusarium oxysporum f. sp. conglutinans]|uniref:Peptidase M20 dimerisation domain-containing protein n=1 Tax=Fusarium oxysporum f. sp. conglutinans TaxID=100902 RepID=A0A8H6G9N1_FUSOX|nr:hypothetical protein HZS61_007127 [Fusarium oxysporum f. sp. conglutinans]
MSSNEHLYEKISKSVAHHEQDLADICKKIHENPEFNYKEFKAHDNICDLMHRLGYNVKRSAYGIQTSFEVESGQNGKLIVFNAEYDALPGLGHACGHNLIATSSIAAFIATAETIRSLNIPGRVRLLGTPAEEGGGGKVHLIKAGAYEGVDACLMAHPTGKLSPQGEKNIDGVSAARSSNVTYCVPGIHPMFAVGTQDPMIQPHTPKFAEAAGTREAFERALDCAKGLAATACEMLLESELMDQARDEFKRDVEPIGYRL